MKNLKQFSLFLKNIEFLLDIVRALSYNNKVANIYAAMAQMVERVLGKDEVTGSIPVSSSIIVPRYGTHTENPCNTRVFRVFRGKVKIEYLWQTNA